MLVKMQTFNNWLGEKITQGLGTMWCAYAFACLAALGLPQAVQNSFSGGNFRPFPLLQWFAQTFLQLVLLSIIIVGQQIAQRKTDARSTQRAIIMEKRNIKTHDVVMASHQKSHAKLDYQTQILDMQTDMLHALYRKVGIDKKEVL